MKRNCLMMLAAAVCAFALFVAVGVWFTISRASDGYEISDGKVHYRTFDNVNWKVVRREVDGADPQTFSTVSGSRGKYGSDQHQVYFHEIWLSHADPTSFQVLDWRQKFSRDANHIYWKSILLSDDAKNFKIMGRGYSKDSENVYFGSQTVKNADPATFIVPGAAASKAKGENHTTYIGQPQK